MYIDSSVEDQLRKVLGSRGEHIYGLVDIQTLTAYISHEKPSTCGFYTVTRFLNRGGGSPRNPESQQQRSFSQPSKFLAAADKSPSLVTWNFVATDSKSFQRSHVKCRWRWSTRPARWSRSARPRRNQSLRNRTNPQPLEMELRRVRVKLSRICEFDHVENKSRIKLVFSFFRLGFLLCLDVRLHVSVAVRLRIAPLPADVPCEPVVARVSDKRNGKFLVLGNWGSTWSKRCSDTCWSVPCWWSIGHTNCSRLFRYQHAAACAASRILGWRSFCCLLRKQVQWNSSCNRTTTCPHAQSTRFYHIFVRMSMFRGASTLDTS